MNNPLPVAAAFVLGLVMGLYGFARNVPDDILIEAFAMCAANNDVDHISVAPRYAIAVCTNGAKFPLKGKEPE